MDGQLPCWPSNYYRVVISIYFYYYHPQNDGIALPPRSTPVPLLTCSPSCSPFPHVFDWLLCMTFSTGGHLTSKATMEYFSIFFTSSTQTMGQRQDTHSTPAAPPLGNLPPITLKLSWLLLRSISLGPIHLSIFLCLVIRSKTREPTAVLQNPTIGT